MLGSNEVAGTESYLQKFIAYVKKSGRSYSSVAFKALPAAGVAMAATEVLGADDMFDTAARIGTGMAGGFAAGGVCAIKAAPIVPPWGSIAAATVCGIVGADGAEKIYDEWSGYLLSSTSTNQPRDIISTNKFNLVTSSINFNQEISAATTNVNQFLSKYSLPLYKNSFDLSKNSRVELLSQSALDNLHTAWYSEPDSKLRDLSKQLNNLNYLIRYESPFLTQEGKDLLSQEKQQMRAKLEQYIPKANEVKLYMEIKSKLFNLESAAKSLLAYKDIDPKELNPNLKKIFKAKSETELKSAWNDYRIMRAKDSTPLSSQEQELVGYWDAHFAHYAEARSENINVLSADEKVKILDYIGKAGIELGKIAYSLKNPELGRMLTLSGSTLQGMSAAIQFMASTGSTAMGNFVGVLSALSSIISELTKDDTNGLEEAFQAIFEQLIQLRQELFELKKFMLQFRNDLFDYLNTYFGAVFSRFIYQEEIIRNGHKKNDYESSQIRAGIDALHEHFDYELIIQVESYYKNIRNANDLSPKEVGDFLTGLKLRLDKAESAYRTGVNTCYGQEKFGVLAAANDVQEMLADFSKRGLLPGYLNCYYRTTNWLSGKNITIAPNVVINPVLWSHIAQLYLFLRKLPNATEYDKDFVELNAIKKQGDAYIDFVRRHQANILPIMQQVFKDINISINATIERTKYPSMVTKLLQKYPVPEYLQKTMNRFGGFTHNGYYSVQELSNEFLALEAIGYGKFSGRFTGGIVLRWLFRDDYSIINNPFEPWPTRDLHKQYIEQNYIQFDYNNSHYNHAVKLAFMSPNDFMRLSDGSWSHSARMTSGPKSYADKVRSEAKIFVSQIRNNATQDILTVLEKELPVFQKNITSLQWQILATFSAVGMPREIIRAMPIFNMLGEISTFLSYYREDLKLDNIYRDLPSLNKMEDALNNYTKSMTNYSFELQDIYKKYNNKLLFRNPDVGSVSSILLEIDNFQTQAMFDAPKKLGQLLDFAKKIVKRQQSGLDNSFNVLDRFLAIINDLPLDIEEDFILWNQTFDNLIRQRNNYITPKFEHIQHRTYVNDGDVKIQPLQGVTDLQNLCSNSSSLLRDVENLLEKLYAKGSIYFRDVLNNSTDLSQRPLHLAILARRIDIIQLLLSYDAVVYKEDLALIYSRADDELSQDIMAVLDFYKYLQSFDLNENFSSGRVLALINKGLEKINSLGENVEDAVFFFGKTAAGKSTAVNKFLGIEYEKTNNGFIPKANHTEKTLTGRSFTSETSLPELFPFEDIFLADMPGFGDTRGNSYEIAAGVITQKLSEVVKQLRLAVLVCETPTYKARSMEMIKVFNMYGRIIGQSKSNMNNVLILINDEIGKAIRSKEEIIDLFKEVADSSQDLEENAKFFMRHLEIKNILIADFSLPNFRQEFVDIVRVIKSRSISEFNLASFHQHVEGFRKLVCHLEEYKNNVFVNYDGMVKNQIVEQLNELNVIEKELQAKIFRPNISYEGIIPVVHQEEYTELNTYLEKQSNWKEWLLDNLITPIKVSFSRFGNLNNRHIGTLQEIEQFASRYIVAQKFLSRVKTTNLQCTEKDSSSSEDSSETATYLFGIPGAAAIEPDISHYMQDRDGFWIYSESSAISDNIVNLNSMQKPKLGFLAAKSFFAHPVKSDGYDKTLILPLHNNPKIRRIQAVSVKSMPNTRFYAGEMQASCAYKWRGILSKLLPRTTIYADDNKRVMDMIPFCSDTEQKIEFNLFGVSTLRLTQAKNETQVVFIPNNYFMQFLHQGQNSFILGASLAFVQKFLRRVGVNEVTARSMQHIFELELLYHLYGSYSALTHVFVLCLQYSTLNLSDSFMKNLSLVLAVGASIYQMEGLSHYCFAAVFAQTLFSSLMHKLGQKTGEYCADNLFNSPYAT